MVHTDAGFGRQVAKEYRVAGICLLYPGRAPICMDQGACGMGASGFPIDLVLFGMIAGFLVLRLRSILGKRQVSSVRRRRCNKHLCARRRGRLSRPRRRRCGRPRRRPFRSRAWRPGKLWRRCARSDRTFRRPARFLAGADQAFRMIVAAFAAGDRAALRPLLARRDLQGVRAGDQRAREVRRDTSIRDQSDGDLSIDLAGLKGQVGQVTARIVSDQVSYTQDRDGRPLTGTDAVTEITDLWTFERDLSQQDPTWRLVAARSG